MNRGRTPAQPPTRASDFQCHPHINRCAVLAAVTSANLTNVAIGVAATDVRPDVSLVMRLGDGNVADETNSLLHLGRICDAHDLIAAAIPTCG